jgi:curli biogenesis system outer membrane secretion channel CsgG
MQLPRTVARAVVALVAISVVCAVVPASATAATVVRSERTFAALATPTSPANSKLQVGGSKI